MRRLIVRERGPVEACILLLPEAPVPGDAAAHWWRLSGDIVTAGGADPGWLNFASPASGVAVTALAPAASVRLDFVERDEGNANPRQAATVARVTAVDRSLGENETLHAVTAELGGDPAATVVAVAANAKLLEWLDWADGIGARIDHIVPSAMLLPLGPDWVRAAVGTERLVGRRGMAVADEPGLTDALLDGEEPQALDPDGLPQALAKVAAEPRPDLRTGRFAQRRIMFDRTRLRELAILAAAIVLVTTLTAIVEIVRLNASTSALDRQTLEVARSVAGPSVALDNAEAELAARAGSSGGGQVSALLSALLARLQGEPEVGVTALGYTGGTMTATLAAASVDPINRVLLALERDGYRITAVPRQGSDGRSMADITVRAS